MSIRTVEDLMVYAEPGPRAHIHVVYAIARITEPKRYLEIGTWAGATAGAVALAAEHQGFEVQISCVDPNPRTQVQDILQRFPAITLYQQKSQDGIPPGPYDMALIDGDHSPEAVKADWQMVKREMAMLSTVLLHDTTLYLGPMLLERHIRNYDREWSCCNLRAHQGLAILTRNLKMVPPSVVYPGGPDSSEECLRLFEEQYQKAK